MSDTVKSGSSYIIINGKSGTVIDLDTTTSFVNGWFNHGGYNQMWTMNWTGSGWTFCNVATGQYLGIQGTPSDRLPIVALATPFEWHIWPDQLNPSNLRIFVPNTHQNLDLYDFGLSTPGNPITLWWASKGIHQTWIFQQA